MRPHDIKLNGAKFRIFLNPVHEAFFRPMMNEIFIYPSYRSVAAEVEFGDVVVDGGACIGIFSLWALVHGASKVIAFEPSVEHYECLSAMVYENRLESSIEIHNAALWCSRESDVRFKFFPKNPLGSHIVDGVVGEGIYSVRTECIDDLNAKIDFIKLDVEGCEVEALMGARRTLKTCKPKLALSLYHKQQDLKLIPQILELFNYTNPVISRGRFKTGVWNRAKG